MGKVIQILFIAFFTIGLISFTPNEAFGQAFDEILFDNHFGHFVCYTHTNQTSPDFPVILEDQFEEQPTIVRNVTQICAQLFFKTAPFPAIEPTINFTDQHYIVYNITETELLAPIATVNITDQFIHALTSGGNVTVDVFEARELWVPANKTHFGFTDEIDPQNEIHWKCYRLEQPNDIPTPIDDIFTGDQFSSSEPHTVFFAGYLCNPVEKSLDSGETFIGDFDIDDHLICYSMNSTLFLFSGPDLSFQDQFINITGPLIDSVRLCNTAAKAVLISGPGPIGAKSLPINPVSLLVAGAYTSSVWILPIVAATVVGVLVFKKRKDK